MLLDLLKVLLKGRKWKHKHVKKTENPDRDDLKYCCVVSPAFDPSLFWVRTSSRTGPVSRSRTRIRISPRVEDSVHKSVKVHTEKPTLLRRKEFQSHRMDLKG